MSFNTSEKKINKVMPKGKYNIYFVLYNLENMPKLKYIIRCWQYENYITDIVLSIKLRSNFQFFFYLS